MEGKAVKQALDIVTGGKDLDVKTHILLTENICVPHEFESNTIYGFNVRLRREDALTPIMGGKKTGQSVIAIAKRIDPNRTILKVFEKYPEREVSFRVKKKGMDNSLSVEADETIGPEIIEKMTSRTVDDKGRGSFLYAQKEEMFPDDDEVYYWICRENKELQWNVDGKNSSDNTAQSTSYLSNILVVSSSEDSIKFAKEHKIDFLRFLFRLQTAYSMVLAKELEASSVRAAIAQVMARNMSHNFGSHVFSNLINDDVYEKLDDAKVKGLEKYISERTTELYKNLAFSENQTAEKKKKNHQLQYFFQYLKSRMDYLSEITFGVSNLLTTKMMYSDVMRELDGVRILLNYISGVSDFYYKFQLKRNNAPMTRNNDIGVALPSDVLGCHAFYNIIENIIRNTAKHAPKNCDSEITFTINIKDIKGCDAEGANELYCVEIDNGVEEENIDNLVEKQNERINSSVLEHNILRSHSLGLLEMEASAAFLRQIDMPDIESEDYAIDENDDGTTYFHERNGVKRLNILKAFAIVDSKATNMSKARKGKLGYRFFIQKTKEFLFVGDRYASSAQEKLYDIGIQFISEEDFHQAMKEKKSFAHKFLFFDENVSKNVKKLLLGDKKCKTLLPLRKLSLSEKDWQEVSKRLNSENSDAPSNETETIEKKKTTLQQLKEWAWEKWMCPQCEKVRIRTAVDRENDEITSNQLVFMNHGTKEQHDVDWHGCEKLGEDGLLHHIKGRAESKCNEVWLENLVSRTWGKLPDFNSLSECADNNSTEMSVSNYVENIADDDEYHLQIRREIFEAYHNKVVVIDERVQKYADENKEGGTKGGNPIMCRALFESTNVHVPDFPLAPNDFTAEYKTMVEKYLKKHNKNAFVVIHYGILERMYNGDVDQIKKKLDEWVKDSKRVVVTSGRGSHSLDLPDSVCFVNLSSMLYAFCENRNKYIINHLLNQSRRKRNEK